MQKIYTRQGDLGQTSLIGSKRFSKGDQIFEVIGNLDELGASLGIAFEKASESTQAEIERIQNELFAIGAFLAGARSLKIEKVRIEQMEAKIDSCFKKAGALKNFILASGSAGSTQLFLARAVARRAERSLCRIDGDLPAALFSYLNRLSDLLFALARLENNLAGKEEKIWKQQ